MSPGPYTGLTGPWPRDPATGALLVSGGGGGTLNPSAGFWVPSGALDRWKTRRAQALAGSALVEVPVFGDSTTFGQTNIGNNTTSANNYSWVQKLRALAMAAGYPDGGVGTRGFYETANMSGPDALAHVQSNTGWVASTTVGGNHLVLTGISSAGASVGNAIVLQGKGTKARLWYTQVASSAAVVTYAVDGGSPVTITATPDANSYLSYVDLPLGAYGTHTITLTVTTAGTMEFTVDWLNASGLSFHKLGQPSNQLTSRFGSRGTGAHTPFAATALNIGIGSAIAAATNSLTSTVNGPRTLGLAVLHLGINDQQTTSGTQANVLNSVQTVEAGVGMFASLCRKAQVDAVVCLPHLNYANQALPTAGNFRRALLATALSHNVAVFDMERPVGLDTAWSVYAAGGTNGGTPHLDIAGYDAQATAFWNALSTV